MAGKLKIKNREGGHLVAILGDEDTITGFLLSGIGNVDAKRQKNFFVVTNRTKQSEIETAFRSFTAREDIAVIMITQTVAEEIRYILNEYDKLIPTILEIPSKETPYDPEKDSLYQRVKKMSGKQ